MLASEASTKPYLIRALHEWCCDQGLTPYLAVNVDERTQVPRAYVKKGEIVLNVSMTATNRLQLGNEFIEFEARFGGSPQQLMIPVGNVTAIFAKESGQGMAFEVQAAPVAPVADPKPNLSSVDVAPSPTQAETDSPNPPPSGGSRPKLTRIK